MPVAVKKLRGKYRIVEADTGRIKRTKTGAWADGGGHEAKWKALRQAGAINAYYEERDNPAPGAKLSTSTSVMKAITQPSRWGYEVVDSYFGVIRGRRNQTTAMAGDLLRSLRSGRVYELAGREGSKLLLTPVG